MNESFSESIQWIHSVKAFIIKGEEEELMNRTVESTIAHTGDEQGQANAVLTRQLPRLILPGLPSKGI